MWFKKKDKESGVNLIEKIVDYIKKVRELNWTDEEIIREFKKKKYPDEWILQAFHIANLNNTKEEKMAEYEDEEIDTSEITDDENLEELEQEKEPVAKPQAKRPVAKQPQQVRPQVRQAPVQKPVENPDRFEFVYQREMAIVVDKTTGKETMFDNGWILTEMLNRLERIEQSL